MDAKDFHPNDQELLEAADGELPQRRAIQVREHLASCWGCRTRMAETERTISGFTLAHQNEFDLQIPPVGGPRARLRAKLTELSARPRRKPRPALFWLLSSAPVAVSICVIFVIVFLIGRHVGHLYGNAKSVTIDSSGLGAVPNPDLTPGAARRVSIREVCSMGHEEVVRQVPNSLRQQVFQEYGIAKPLPNDYEIDYLIAPGLGGVDDIHNLWPEPYSSPVWNAYVKDDLEEQLHRMVCAGKLDLVTAQRDISKDWIAAYKKYFHTDKPLLPGSERNRAVANSTEAFLNPNIEALLKRRRAS